MIAFNVAAFLVTLQLGASVAMPKSKSVIMPEECEGMSYCLHKGNHYPDKEILKLNEWNRLPHMVYNTSGTNDFGPRSGEYEITRELCPYDTKNASVYYIVDQNNKPRVVVQLPKVLEQVFEFRSCKKPGNITESISQLRKRTLKKWNFYCEDIYYRYEFYVLSDNKMGLEKAVIQVGLPVFCACKYDISAYTNIRNYHYWNEDSI